MQDRLSSYNILLYKVILSEGVIFLAQIGWNKSITFNERQCTTLTFQYDNYTNGIDIVMKYVTLYVQ